MLFLKCAYILTAFAVEVPIMKCAATLRAGWRREGVMIYLVAESGRYAERCGAFLWGNINDTICDLPIHKGWDGQDRRDEMA